VARARDGPGARETAGAFSPNRRPVFRLRLNGSVMFDPEIVALVGELEALGVKFIVLPRLDGSMRLNTWRMQGSWPNRDRINHLLAERIENEPEVAALIAELVSRRSAEAVSTPPEG
jgi:hypothetical protein